MKRGLNLLLSVIFMFSVLLRAPAAGPAQGGAQRLPAGRGADITGVRYERAERTHDAELERAIRRAIGRSEDARATESVGRYFYNRVDLNGDGRPEVLAYLMGLEFCGTGGCNLLVFQSGDNGYRLLAEISLVNNPVVVSRQRTRGWNDLILYVAGGGITRGHYVRLSFDGRRYPANPTVLPALRRGTRIAGVAYMADEVSPEAGLPLSRAQSLDRQ